MSESSLSIKGIINILSLAIYLIFICSVTYNYAYLWAIGLSPSQIPISVSDIVNSAFTWAPIVTILLAVGFFNELITRRIEHGKNEDEM
jgi:Na+/alanine symporter